jgi:peptide/nickel transport system substrate-binding protein
MEVSLQFGEIIKRRGWREGVTIVKIRAILLASVLVLVAACGGDDDGTSSTDPPPDATETSNEATGDDQTGEATADDPTGEETGGEETGSEDTGDETADDPTGEETAAKPGGDFVYALPSFPKSFDPLTVSAASDRTVGAAVYDTLLDLDEQGVPQPLLASSYDSPDDGATWVVGLREGIEFSDGSPFDAAAVVAHTERMMNPENACACASLIGALESVEASGPMEVSYHLSPPSASFPVLLAESLGMIVGPANTPENPVGAGPFLYEETRDGEYISVVANPNYWQEGLPYLDSVEYRVLPDPATRLAALESGDIDMYWEPIYTNWAEVRDDENLQLLQYGGFGSWFVLFNMEQPPFDNPDARLAAAKALDLVTLHETLSAGEVGPATSIFPRTSWSYPGEIADYPVYDLDGAKALVDSLGGLSFTITVPQLVYERAVAIQAMFQEAGMDVEVETGENLAMIQKFRDADFEAGFSGYSAGADPFIFAQGYRYDNARNYSNMNSPEFDALVDQADTVTDQDARKAIFAEMAQLHAELLPFLIVNNYNDAFAAGSDVQNVPVIPDGLFRPTGVWLDR